MIIAVPKEIENNETRVSITPQSAAELIKAGYKVKIESNAGKKSFFFDKDYQDVNAEIISSKDKLFDGADIILKVTPPSIEEIKLMSKGTLCVSFFQPTIDLEKVKTMTDMGITGMSMHLVPRTTLAQKMDALSSQANIAGYKAVLMGSVHMGVYMPLLMTAAGTIRPAKVLILGAGVAGLQAIATAKRLGSQVEAFDVRPEVKEQVESLGAKFIEVESNNTEGVGEGGYAKETSDDYKKQQELKIKERASKADLVITTALIPGKPAPILINENVVENMKRGSVIVDLASENGGNCELTQKDEIINHKGVIIDGTSNFPATMQAHASQLYAKNISSFIIHMMNEGEINLDLDDEIISGAMFTHKGEITHQPTNELASNS